MADLLDEIGAYLVAQGRGTLATNLFLGYLPTSPSTLIAVYEYAGAPPSRTMRNTTKVENPRIQVVCRDASYSAAKATARSVWNDLNVGTTMLSGTNYLAITPLQSPFLLKRDSDERVLIAANFEAQRALS